MKNLIRLIIICILFCACSEVHYYAPVTEINKIEKIPKRGFHLVSAGQTLYAIAWQYGLDYRFLAQRNKIKFPYTIYRGQKIYLKAIYLKTSVGRKALPITPLFLDDLHETDIGLNASSKWMWPAKGRVINAFSGQNKGININGSPGDPIFAAAPGKVVYCGNGLRGYGNLIILKHNSLYLSAYAHNRAVFVKEGESVKQGQIIGEMGRTGSDKVMLHFEIRRAGEPINPITLLNS